VCTTATECFYFVLFLLYHRESILAELSSPDKKIIMNNEFGLLQLCENVVNFYQCARLAWWPFASVVLTGRFPITLLGVGWESGPPRSMGSESSIKTRFLKLNPQMLKRCNMVLWSACLVPIHLHHHCHHSSHLQKHPEFRASVLSFYSWCFFFWWLPFALFQSSKKLLFSTNFLSKYVVRVTLLFGPLASHLAALTSVSLEW
jgi:hypothetical protein